METFDLLLIGSGPGGQRAAIQAAKLGKRAAVIERREIVGAVTAHTGTIPSKSLHEAVLYLCGWREKGIHGRSHRVKSDITAQDLFQRLGEEVGRVEKAADGTVVTHLKSGKKICSDLLMVAAGRTGATRDLDLEKAGVPADSRGRLTVQPSYQTEVPHIYAVGDVIGFPALASTSAEQGRLAACHAFGGSTETATDYFPVGIYAVPEISIVGKTEQQLRNEGIAYETGIARLRETARGQIQGVQDGLLKLLFGLRDHRLLGAHIVGEGATELIHIGQAVIAHNGTLEYFVGAVFNYPTFAEAYKIAALDAWNRVRV